MSDYLFLIAFALVLIANFAAAAQAQQNASGIRAVDFGNFSYRAAFGDPANEKTIRLKNGKFEDGGKYDEGGQLYELFDKPVFGDLNGDKTEDAVVEIKLSGAPSYRAFEVQAYTFQNGQTKLLVRIDSDRVLKDYQKYYRNGDLHYAGNNPPKIENGSVIVEALTDGSFACPKYVAAFAYKLIGGKFVLSGKPARKQFSCN